MGLFFDYQYASTLRLAQNTKAGCGDQKKEVASVKTVTSSDFGAAKIISRSIYKHAIHFICWCKRRTRFYIYIARAICSR